MNKIITVIFILLLATTSTMAQDDDQQISYATAESLYKYGYFDRAEAYLLDNIGNMKGIHKSSAYRLLALCSLQRGSTADAEYYIDKLLQVDPYYTPTLNDPQRFVDIVEAAKEQETGITTASRQAESIDEAPVPVTVITSDMIRLSGATTLKELLCLFVPGMSQAEGMESNIAMHGISGLTQESILFLQDGHRLNGSSSNAEAPDYRNSLDKIQQIEVLRGPASSLYGNVALTAVVNIITYNGARLNGGRISGIIGTQSTYGGSFVVGGGNNVVDITGWGSINATNGFKHQMYNEALKTPTTLYSHGFNRRPAYDVGIKARWGNFTMTINSQRSKQTPYFNVMQLSATRTITDLLHPSENFFEPNFQFEENFSYDKYPNVNSNGPGTTRTNHHITLDFARKIGKVDFQASAYISMEHTSFYNVLGDSINTGILLQMGLDANLFDTLNVNYATDYETLIPAMMIYYGKYGNFINIDWENITIGGQAQILTKYNFLGHGSAIFGVQNEHFALTEGNFNLGMNYSTDNMITKGNIFRDGMEDIISGYTQIKHYFSQRFIVNAGLRFDHKRQFNDTRLNQFSPRLSLIYKINPAMSARASYNVSYVDAPYLYRAVELKMLGGADLQPEKMRSFQAGLTYHKPNSHFTAELSGNYNRIINFLTQDYGSNNATSFHSSGRMRQICIDGSAQYSARRLLLNANMTWQKIVKSAQECNIVDGNRLGVPQLMGNFIGAWAPFEGVGHGYFHSGKLWFNTTISAQSSTHYQNVDFILASHISKLKNNGYNVDVNYLEYVKVPPQIVIGIGTTYEWKYLDISLTLKNITNNQYKVGSYMSGGVPNAGRQLLGKVTIKF